MSDEKKFIVKIPGPSLTASTTNSRILDAGSTVVIAEAYSFPAKPPFPTKLLILCPELSDPSLIILKYEIEMYRIGRWRLKEQGNLPDRHVRNSVVESAVVHARNLCSFFCDGKSKKYLTLADVTNANADPFPELRGKLKKAYNGRPRQAFNEFVAHMTQGREKNASGYGYDPEFNAIDPYLKPLIEHVIPLFSVSNSRA
jgi:hypothetical protein